MRLGNVLMERCPYCSNFRHPGEFIRAGTGGQVRLCWYCYEWHHHALMLLAGSPPPGCQECGVTFADLEARSPGGNTSMFAHQKDGIYQILCRECDAKYVPKRRELYVGTQFAQERRL